ncbi:MAG: KamA family radical SAM protein, partial [Candidatus Aminicenantes bacterium]|nr:KamA family radical SAM protein [Candidatus Aminicenantes bacterium]
MAKTKLDQELIQAGTKIIDDVFTDDISLFKPKFEVDYDAYLQRLWEANPDIHSVLKEADSLEAARDALFTYLEKAERRIFAVDNDLHILEKATVREGIRVFKSIIGPVNEYRTGVSALTILWELAGGRRKDVKTEVSVGFLMEFINLFRSVTGRSNIYLENREVKKHIPDFLKLEGKEAAEARTEILDGLGTDVKKYFKKFPSGLEEEVIEWRKTNRSRIMQYFGGGEQDWDDYTWHLKNVVNTAKPLIDLIELTKSERKAIEKANANNIPFGITPYYLSLMDSNPAIGYDHAVRAQVIPTEEYVNLMVSHRSDRNTLFDFMGEHDTSPVDLVTRRYPFICIIKPFNTCSQICVYCQRNWEIDRVLDPKALASREKADAALAWLDDHPTVGDVLLTGGDPLVMKDEQLERLLEGLAAKKQIYRIRLGTRTPVVLPMRWTDKLMGIITRYHNPPDLEIAVVTHFEHSYEITPESMKAVQKIRRAGMSVYNQVVYTIENSRRFELAKLRRDLKAIGIDPYYTFNMKGKEETKRYMVPIARILQERKEEARLLPGLDRTDEPVFNVPKLGKNHLRA